MGRHFRTLKYHSNSRIRRKAKPNSFDEQARKPGELEIVGALNADKSPANTIQGALLSDTRLSVAHKRALASQIVQLHGNKYLQRLVTHAGNQNILKTKATEEIQRQPTSATEATTPVFSRDQLRDAYWEMRRRGGPQVAAFHAEVDRRFWAQTDYKVGERLDPDLAEDRPYVRIWLQIRDEVMNEQMSGAGSASPATAGPEAVGPSTRGTAFGTFDVYPDDFIGPLPRADYATGNWPVRQAVFNRIQSVITSISGGGAGIKIEGTNVFKSAVLMDLAWLMTQNVGMNLIEAIVATRKNLTIRTTSGGNTTSYNPDADSYEIPATGSGPPAPGRGANITIGYNTQEWNPYGGEEAWMRRPPAIGLAHEMVHAWTGMSGIRAVGETGGVRRRELQASGLGEFATFIYTENRFRAAFGLPARPRY